MRVRHSIVVLCCLFIIVSCCNTKSDINSNNKSNDITITETVINSSFTGNGIQWGGYDMVETWTGNTTLSDSDWEKLFKRVRFMRPPLVRIMVAPGWNYIIDGKYNPEKSEPVLCKILDFCQQENISVIYGEWGHTGGTSIDQDWLTNSVNFLDWLINTKGYTCIHYFNMVNEPAGYWSTIDGNYDLWKSLINQFYSKLVEKGLDSKVTILGPDVAIWDTSLLSWVKNTVSDLSGKVNAYDIHTYPTETIVRDGSYSDLVKKYRNAAPSSKEMLMTELGFKYSSTSTLGIENAKRIAADKYASDDSNMFIYDGFYAIDIADAIIQNMLAGYGGNILWDLDDAMYYYNSSNPTKLKRWGFWNILGAERFGSASDEDIRPWFYTASLLSKYFPKGTHIFSVTLPNKYGLRAVAGEYNGKHTIAIVNSHTVSYTINLKMENGEKLEDLSIYKYISGDDSNFTANVDGNGFASPESTGETIDFGNGASKQLTVPAKSFYLITNMNRFSIQ